MTSRTLPASKPGSSTSPSPPENSGTLSLSELPSFTTTFITGPLGVHHRTPTTNLIQIPILHIPDYIMGRQRFLAEESRQPVIRVCESGSLVELPRVISRDPLVLDCRHVIHAEYLTRVATTVTKLPTHFRVVSNLIHQLNHAPGISPVEEATLHGHGKRVSHLNGIHAHVVAEAVHLCDGLYVPVVTVSAQRPYTLVFDPGRYVIPILIVIDVGAVDHTTGHAAVFPLSSPILAVLMQRLAADGLRLVKPAEVEVVGGESTGLVDDVNQYGGTVVGQAFTRDRMTLQSVNQGLPRLVKAFLVLDCGTVHSSIVHNHGLDTTRRHHRTQASAACVT